MSLSQWPTSTVSLLQWHPTSDTESIEAPFGVPKSYVSGLPLAVREDGEMIDVLQSICSLLGLVFSTVPGLTGTRYVRGEVVLRFRECHLQSALLPY